MKEKTLLKIALLCSVVGIVLLFLVSENIEIDEKAIDKINMDNIGDYVKIKGQLSKIIDTESVMILTIQQPSQITVVLFKKRPIELREGNYVEVIGKIEDYEGKTEIIADKIRVIS